MAAPVTLGQRDRNIEIQQLTESVSASQFPVESWTRLCMVWANKSDVEGVERFVANQESAPYDTRWTIPYFAAMDPELVDVRKARRLIVNGRVHDIVEAKELGRREGVELRTVAGGLVR